MAEWLRRWIANPLCSARLCSNPILVDRCVQQCFLTQDQGTPLLSTFLVWHAQFSSFSALLTSWWSESGILNKCNAKEDEVTEWLRRWTAKPLCSARVGSNPILVDICVPQWFLTQDQGTPLLSTFCGWFCGRKTTKTRKVLCTFLVWHAQFSSFSALLKSWWSESGILNKCDAKEDEVAEWLRRWTANPLCSARVGSNPVLVDICVPQWFLTQDQGTPLLSPFCGWFCGRKTTKTRKVLCTFLVWHAQFSSFSALLKSWWSESGILNKCDAKKDEVAEWLRRWTANPLCFARVGSNPILVGWCIKWWFWTQDLGTPPLCTLSASSLSDTLNLVRLALY